jgi:hypothetical protein
LSVVVAVKARYKENPVQLQSPAPPPTDPSLPPTATDEPAAPAANAAAPNSHADRHGAWADSVADWKAPIDLSRPFVCDSLTPLYYTSLFGELYAAQRLRYNQLSAISFNELIVFFEHSFDVALEALLTDRSLKDNELRGRIGMFLDDERRHVVMWRRLNRATADAGGGRGIVRIRRPMSGALRLLASRPRKFPVVVLVMLTLEEHSIDISRRCGRTGRDALEPHYAAAYRAHLADEVQHVRVDRELLDVLIEGLPPWLRAVNAALYRRFIRTMWLRPTAAGGRVVEALVREYPQLRPIRPRLLGALETLDRNSEFRRMMFSPQTFPLTFSVIRRYGEFSPECDAGGEP